MNVFNLLLAIALMKPALTAFRGGQIMGTALTGRESSLVTDVATEHMAISFWSTLHPDLIAWLDTFYAANLRAGGEQPKSPERHHAARDLASDRADAPD